MIDNTALLQELFSDGRIALENAPFLSSSPAPLPANWDFRRIEGMLLWLAVGDALGNTTESQIPQDRRAVYGEIRDYLPNRHAAMKNVGLPSDDSQMAFWTLEQLLADGGLNPDHLAQVFANRRIFGIGGTVTDFLRAYKGAGKPWYLAGQPSAGNGALMRIAPVIIPHLRQPSPALWADAVLAACVTHNDPASTACCVAFTHIIWECLRLESPPDPLWWLEQFVHVARQLEGDSQYVARHPSISYRGPLWQFVDQEVRRALAEDWSVMEASSRWYSGAYLLETMPCVLYILARHAAEPEQALVRAVNDIKDNDTVAAIVGAALGALHGRHHLPARWVSGLLGRTGEADDWRVFELIEEARQAFWDTTPQPSQQDIQAVLDFMPLIEQPGFQPGEWVNSPGTLGYFNYSSQALEFLTTLGRHNFIYPFDWMQWEEGRQLVARPELVQKASLQTLRKLLTAHVRSDRFVEGHLAEAFESGQMLAILRRLADFRA